MIGRLQGILIEKKPPYLLLDVMGVGYEVQAPMTTFYRLSEIGQSVVLHTHLSISENLHQLFGFIEERDRALFRTLIKVNSVGPKLAIAILSGMETDEIVRCVRENKVDRLTQVPGIGKKIAERLVVELRDRLKTWGIAAETSQSTIKSTQTVDKQSVADAAYIEAESALIALGYKPADAAKMISVALKQKSDANSEELIRTALRSVASL